ncbi:purine-nucleoside phosphorylase [Vulcanibacillus modesticaldus]|uniref:Purine nucleoside phosphorylase n=1 Tax=Vulcanibacillus modesticaldus TaxID=337097 RepID=A0A1D2YSE8_9BACI|nr:purine-nucleoside phosphorylase [Vulcanibacillus modesticaldus]OEF97233.1 purine-nucleoside phosphorylase [Vulcanibacillus modesticaldus]
MLRDKINETAEYIKAKINITPEIGLILGSGLGVLADEIEDAIKISYHDIPHFPVSTVEGHKGQLVIGRLSGKNVIAMQGRFHYYEGYSLKEVTFPVRVMKALGVEKLIVTNAAGGVNTSFEPGDLMIITDHINFMFDNPLMGPNDNELGVRFPDMSEVYSQKLIEIAKNSAKDLDIEIKEGVYTAFTGPSYETPAEIKMIRTIGGDAVGMSTVPEAMVARHSSMDVLGISCITNMAAGILPQPLSHDEVIETTNLVQAKFLSLVREIVSNL